MIALPAPVPEEVITFAWGRYKASCEKVCQIVECSGPANSVRVWQQSERHAWDEFVSCCCRWGWGEPAVLCGYSVWPRMDAGRPTPRRFTYVGECALMNVWILS